MIKKYTLKELESVTDEEYWKWVKTLDREETLDEVMATLWNFNIDRTSSGKRRGERAKKASKENISTRYYSGHWSGEIDPDMQKSADWNTD